MRKAISAVLVLLSAFVVKAEIQVVDGVKYECKDGLCRMMGPADELAVDVNTNVATRLTQGYQSAEEFVAFLENRSSRDSLGEKGLWLMLLLVLLGGLVMNLTPCVLPMVPINLMVIGKSALRGAAYGFGTALAYGALGVAAAVGGLAFGTIQANPWFNLGVAVVFVCLALALFNVFFLDFSRFRPIRTVGPSNNKTLLFPFFMGALSAVLAGACVAPILISVLLLTAKLYAEGKVLALGLPFVLGLGMALPWPFLGAGLQVLPRPGAWMKYVNRLFGVVVLGFAVWYGWLAVRAYAAGEFQNSDFKSQTSFVEATPSTFSLQASSSKVVKPVLVDCWATWCKNCAAMDRVLAAPAVQKALERFNVIRLQAEDIGALRKLPGFADVRGLPAFVIFE